MIHAEIRKVSLSGYPCDNPECKHSPLYTTQIAGANYHLKLGTDYLLIMIDEKGYHGITTSERYCRGCIDSIYKKLKPVLDSKLWIFY